MKVLLDTDRDGDLDHALAMAEVFFRDQGEIVFTIRWRRRCCLSHPYVRPDVRPGPSVWLSICVMSVILDAAMR